MQPAKKLYFIIGIGRSGTTLLTKLLNQYPALHCLPEANFLIFFLHQYKHKTRFTSADIDLLFREIEVYSRTHPLVGWDFDPVNTRKQVNEYLERAASPSFSELCKIIYSQMKVSGANKEGASVLLDKNPAYTLFLDHIHDYFREANYIFITRDYRANVLSRKQNAFLKSTNVAYNAFRWKWFNQRALKFMWENKDRVHHLRYEDLAEDPDKEIGKILDFLKVSRQREELPEINGAAAPPKVEVKENYQDYFEKKYTDLSKPVNTSRVSAWKTELSKKEIATCDAICASFAEEFGYSAVCKSSGLSANLPALTFFVPYVKAITGIWKERIVYYISPAVKMKRLQKVYKKLGFE